MEEGNQIAPMYFCVDCDNKVTNAMNTRSKRCKPCAVNRVRMMRIYNSRKYNGKKKKFVSSMLKEANRQFGIIYVDKGDPYSQSTRIDLNHSSWNFVPNGFNVKGTISKADLEVDENGRIRALVKLKKEINKRKDKIFT